MLGYLLDIPSGMADVLIGAAFVALLGWLGFMMRQALKISTNNVRAAVMLEDHDRRITRLEAWRDGAQFGATSAHTSMMRTERDRRIQEETNDEEVAQATP